MFSQDGNVPLLGVASQSTTTSAASLEPCCRTNGVYKLKSLKSAKESMDHVFTEFEGLRRNQSAARAKRSLTVASVFCLLFMVAQAIGKDSWLSRTPKKIQDLLSGGYAAGSLAIMGDAAHLFSDFTSLMVSLFSLCLAKRQASVKMTFGWHRAGKLTFQFLKRSNLIFMIQK